MNNVILIGYMGCGKSTVGRRLSYRIRKPFLDTDNEIEHREKETIANLFASKGEGFFRDLETKCLQNLLRNKGSYVISVGGGLPIRAQNQELLHKLGCVIYLRIQPDTVWERLKNDTRRPLLKSENPREKIEAMIAERGPVYEAAADNIIDVDGKTFQEIISEIQQILEEKGVLKEPKKKKIRRRGRRRRKKVE